MRIDGQLRIGQQKHLSSFPGTSMVVDDPLHDRIFREGGRYRPSRIHPCLDQFLHGLSVAGIDQGCMSVRGQTEKSGRATGKSALPSVTDIVRQARQVRKVPIGDSCTAAMTTVIWLPLAGVGDLQSENIATAVLSCWATLPQSIA
jgi:hypothetical protein